MWREEFYRDLPEEKLTARADGRMIKLTPDLIDRAMETEQHNQTVIKLQFVSQAGLEHFVQRYGSTYRSIQLSWEGVKDLSPLGDLPNLEHVGLYFLRCDRLWDMSRNAKLRVLTVDECRKITAMPSLLETATALETVWFQGGAESTYPMESLAGFAHLPAIRELRLRHVRLKNRDLGFLATIPTLRTFDFPPQLFTTEEIAWMKAHYPDLDGRFLGAYGPAWFGSRSWVRVSGNRKPELRLPDDQERLDRYVAQFDALVEQYRQEAKQ